MIEDSLDGPLSTFDNNHRGISKFINEDWNDSSTEQQEIDVLIDEVLEPLELPELASRKSSNFKEIAIDEKLLSILKYCLDSQALRKDSLEY